MDRGGDAAASGGGGPVPGYDGPVPGPLCDPCGGGGAAEGEDPYTIYSGVQFFNRAEVKDALSYLRMIAYQDDLSFRRIANTPKRNLGKRRMAFLQEYGERQGCSLYQALRDNLEDPLFQGTKARAFVSLIQVFSAGYGEHSISEVLAAVLNESGYEAMLRTEGSQERLDNLAELKQSVYEYETTCGEESTLEHYLAHVALFTNSDAGEPGDKVKLMTVHAAKGLEFPYVFLCGMNEGIFPRERYAPGPAWRRSGGWPLWPSPGRSGGCTSPRRTAGTLTALPGTHPGSCWRSARSGCSSPSTPQEGLIRAARDYIEHSQKYLTEENSTALFAVGQRVRHAAFGLGDRVGGGSGSGGPTWSSSTG